MLGGSPGEAAGLKPGGSITAINGTPPSDDPNDPVQDQAAGLVLHLTVRRSSTVYIYDITLRDVL